MDSGRIFASIFDGYSLRTISSATIEGDGIEGLGCPYPSNSMMRMGSPSVDRMRKRNDVMAGRNRNTTLSRRFSVVSVSPMSVQLASSQY